MSGGLMSGGRMSGGRLSGGLKSYDLSERYPPNCCGTNDYKLMINSNMNYLIPLI